MQEYELTFSDFFVGVLVFDFFNLHFCHMSFNLKSSVMFLDGSPNFALHQYFTSFSARISLTGLTSRPQSP